MLAPRGIAGSNQVLFFAFAAFRFFVMLAPRVREKRDRHHFAKGRNGASPFFPRRAGYLGSALGVPRIRKAAQAAP
jgi:hypothetical protein